MSLIKSLARDEEGASLVEYTVLIGIITVAAITAIIYVGSWVGVNWSSLQTKLQTTPVKP